MTNVSKGPSVTRYELQPEMGTKVSRITGLADDIKLNMAAADIRIEAPIPGKAAVGIEIPNEGRDPVYLKELLNSKELREHKSKLAFPAGKDIAGRVVVADIIAEDASYVYCRHYRFRKVSIYKLNINEYSLQDNTGRRKAYCY